MLRHSRPVAPAIVRIARFLPLAVLAAALANCGPSTPPPAPLPSPPKPVPPPPPPPKPRPPYGASDNFVIPPLDASGLRKSVNRGISSTQMLWNLRSAFNVAALNCSDPRHIEILPRYRVFLKNYNTTLMAANRKVDAEFKARYGAKFTAPREAYMTSVYNHFALPPAMGEFCNAVLAVTNDLAALTPAAPPPAPVKKGKAKAPAPRTVTLKPAELEAFAVRSLPNIEVVYDDFYRRYETYRSDLAEWNAKYGPAPAPTAMTGTP